MSIWPGFEPQQLGVLVRDDLDGEAIEIRQRRRRRRPCASSAGCASKTSRWPGTYSVSTNGPRPASPTGGVDRPQALANVPAFERRLELVPRQNRQVVEQPQARRERRRKRDRRPCAGRRRRPSSFLPPTCSASASALPVFASYTASNENTTSSAVNGWPSENVTFGRSFSV